MCGGDAISYSAALGQGMWNSAVESIANLSRNTVLYVRGNLGAMSGTLEGDLAGGIAAKYGGEAGTDAMSVAAGVRMDLRQPESGERTISWTTPGVAVTKGVKLVGTATTSYRNGVKLNSVGFELNASASRFGTERNVPGGSTQVNSLPSHCRGDGYRCGKP